MLQLQRFSALGNNSANDTVNAIQARQGLIDCAASVVPVLHLGIAKSQDEIRQAQRLRYQVFADEYQAQFKGSGGIDEDEFDAHCEHLIVRCEVTDRVVGTYRILGPKQAKHIGRYYSESEFDLSGLADVRGDLVEFGRSCVHADYRDGAAIMLLWSGLAGYLKRTGHRHVFGCASVSLRDGGLSAAAVYEATKNAARDDRYCVLAKKTNSVAAFAAAGGGKVPPLLKGYLRLGAKVCGEPAWDPDFNTVDYPVLMRVDTMSGRYRKHFDL